jgi:hypothetical protein
MIHPVTAGLSLAGLAAGQYELEMRVGTDDQASVTRRVNFGLR